MDVVSLLDLAGLVFTGIVMKYPLPPGSGRGINAKELWSMNRHEWGSIHFYMAVVFVILMVIHIILHWTWVKHYIASVGRRRSFKQ